MSEAAPLLEMKGIRKRFPGVLALDGVDLTVQEGEVLALLGENGAGKSTLIKMLGGAHQPDEGEIRINEKPVSISSAKDARDAGIAVIYQEFNLVPRMTVLENLFLGREKTRLGWIDERSEREQAIEWLSRLGLDIDPDECCGDLSVARQQAVEIARALSFDARILVMDEPSAVLTDKEVEKLFGIVKELRENGIGIIYISHRLDEIDEIADRLVVLRDGKRIGTREVTETSRDELIEMMVGRSLEEEFPSRDVNVGEERLRVENLSRGRFVRDVSFSVRAGEIVGFSGLVGAGRTEAMRLIAGADVRDRGIICVDGKEVPATSPRSSIASGICLLSEDRKGEGLVLNGSAVDNFGLPNLRRFSRFGVLDETEEREEFSSYTEELSIRLSSADQRVGDLSGGNQQKVVLAKWLARHADVILFDEPTRGIDVGAKFEIYQLMNRLAAAGKAIVMVSSELPEIMGMSDRIIVMREGRIAGELKNTGDLAPEEVLALAMNENAA
ncbi:MAG: sugar ABC transporter ATP-binding protein [Verrucomicrobiales bacterium]|nr:sugar ABC transporter ATP-binding protein [Verrucomicrobiales bacterium]